MGGTLNGNIFTTDEVTEDCDITVTFSFTGASNATLSITPVKAFRFSWSDNGASHYRLLENPDGSTGFTQVGADIPAGTEIFDHVVPLHQRVNAQYILQSCFDDQCNDSDTVSVSGTLEDAIGYFKASNTGAIDDEFGHSIDIDGDTLVVGALGEDSNTTGINSIPNDDSDASGAVYVFTRAGITWAQQAYLKADNTGASDQFGHGVAIDGDTIVVGAPRESSNTTGASINSAASNDNALFSGAAYVFVRTDSSWEQQAYLKASNTSADDQFGISVDIDGDTVVIGAYKEDSIANDSGAAYVFVRTGTSWAQEDLLKASNAGANDEFGLRLAISGDTVVVGAHFESSDTNNLGSANDDAANSGAAYVFFRNGSTWPQQAYLKAVNIDAGDRFGESVAIDGDTVVVGAILEDSDSTGAINTSGAFTTPNELISNSGAAYVFLRTGTDWAPQAYLKASNTGDADQFGVSVAVNGDTVVVGAYEEDSDSIGINSTPNDNVSNAGAAYVFFRTGSTWSQQAYLKASNTGDGDNFGLVVATQGDTLVVGAREEDSDTIGVSSTPNDNFTGAGAVYVY